MSTVEMTVRQSRHTHEHVATSAAHSMEEGGMSFPDDVQRLEAVSLVVRRWARREQGWSR